MKEVMTIEEGEIIEHIGDFVVTHDVKSNAVLKIINGSLTVYGHVLPGAKISLIIPKESEKSNYDRNGDRISSKEGFKIAEVEVNIAPSTGTISEKTIEYANYLKHRYGIDYRLRDVPPPPIGNFKRSHHLGTVRHYSTNGSSLLKVEDKNKAVLTVHGKIYTGVCLISDAELIVKEIEDNCKLISAESSIKATKVGNRVELCAKKGINIYSIGDNCKITSEESGIIVENTIGSSCILNANAIIRIKGIANKSKYTRPNNEVRMDVGNYCKLTSVDCAIRAKKVGNHVTMNAKKDLKLKRIGNYCNIVSEDSFIIISHRIGKHCTLSAKNAITVRTQSHFTYSNLSVNDYCELTSRESRIQAQSIGNNVIINAKKAVRVFETGNNCKLTSTEDSITVNKTGIDCTLRAMHKLKVNNTGIHNELISKKDNVESYSAISNNSNIEAYLNVGLYAVKNNVNIISHKGVVSIEKDCGDNITIKLNGMKKIFKKNVSISDQSQGTESMPICNRSDEDTNLCDDPLLNSVRLLKF